jgi:hypothetical protein
MKNWLKKKFKKDSFLFPSIIIFVFTFLMIGFSSDSIRYFFLNVIQITLVALLATIILNVFVEPFEEEDKDKFPAILFWAVIAFMLTLGKSF